MTSTPIDPETKETLWEGFAERDCGDHRTTGGRAWCFSCSEWCYERTPCRGCELPQLRRLVLDLGRHLTALCNHPINYADRYNTKAGRPCTGCYDTRDAFAAWVEREGGGSGVSVPVGETRP